MLKIKSGLIIWMAVLLFPCLGNVVTAKATDAASKTEEKPYDIMENLKFRNLGPAVGGGRVTAVVGVPGRPNLYYAGAAAGGVFKTVDGGVSWKPIFEKEPAASIGAIALAPSNPNLVWVGTGEANIRNDVVTGHGVYFSPDAGASWKFMGLGDVGQISSIIVNPANPDIVFAGALGHAWAPNSDRGVYRTTDGGKTWQKVLFVDDKTGVGDMIMDPGNPMVLFAGMWQVQRFPWTLESGGPSSGIYRSTDGGSTWKKLTAGLPEGLVGRIGLAAAPSNPNHIYALVEAKKGRLWDSNDLGDHWKLVSDNHTLTVRGFYFSHLFVAPNDEEKIYFLSFVISESTDGGKTAHPISRGVHPDHHALWIDPQDPDRLIEGNDGGVYVSSDAGRHWRYLDNLPIEQFYAVAADDHTPYNLCGGLQDNNAWCGPSNSLGRGGITGFDWITVVGGDGEYAVPAPGPSHLVYADSQNGSIAQLDTETGLSHRVRPYLNGVEEFPLSDLKYRFNWTSPIEVSRTDPNEVYLAGNVLFKSMDGGSHWSTISPDLTRNDKSKQTVPGGPIEYDISGAESYDTILSMSISPVDSQVIWVGTDDGLVQVTRDGGGHWTNVTANIPKLPEWGRIQQIDAGPFSAGTCYVAVDFHETDNNHAYVFKTHDFGQTWTAIAKGLPDDEPARVVREDPNHQGFLVLGTDAGLFYSATDGEEWKPLKSNFPTVPVYDLKFIKRTHDLVVATHGRGLFVLDNMTPLEEMTPQVAAQDFHLFPLQTAYRWHTWNKHGFSSGGYVAPNPLAGASIDYYLKSEIKEKPGEQGSETEGRRPGMGPGQGPVKITITDADGKLVNTLHAPAKQGFNRFSWHLDYEGATKLAFLPPDPQEEDNPFFDPNAGPPVAPGTYKVTVTVKGQSQTQTVRVESDPRFHVDPSVFEAQTRAGLEGRDEVSALNRALNRMESLHAQLGALEKVLQSSGDGSEESVPASYRPVLERARTLDKKLRKLEEDVYNTELQPGGEDDVHYLARLHDRLTEISRGAFMNYDQPPRALILDEMANLRKELDTHLQTFNDFLKTDVPAFNKMALEKGANTLFAGDAIEIKGEKAGATGAAQTRGGGDSSPR